MARAPLTHALEQAAGDAVGTTRRQLLRRAGTAVLGLTALARFGPAARGATAPRIVVVGAGLAGLTCAYRLTQAGYAPEVFGAADRIGGRCWTLRGAFAEGQLCERGGELIDQGHTAIRQLAHELGLVLRQPLERGAERRGGAGLLRRSDLLVRGDDRRHQAGVAEDPFRRLRRRLPDDIRQLHSARPRAGPDVDRRLDRGLDSWRAGVPARTAPRRRLHDRVRRRLGRAELAQPPLPARLRRTGPVPRLRQVGREVPRPGRQRSDLVPPGGAARRPDHDRRRARRCAADGRRRVLAHLPPRVRFADGARRRGSSGASVLDFAPLRGRLACRLLGAQAAGDPRPGDGDELEAARPVHAAALGEPRLQRGDVLRPRLPEHVGRDPGAARPVGNPRRLHGRRDRCALRFGHACFARAAVPLSARAGIARHLAALEQPSDCRLLARLRVDARLLLVLESRASTRPSRVSRAAGKETCTSAASTPRSTSRAT
jgi:hypothetical protein